MKCFMNSTKKTATIEQTAELLMRKQRIALFSHTNPDGDTIGASVALCHALQQLGKSVDVFCDCDLSDTLQSFIDGQVVHRNFAGKYDLYVAVDCGDIFRLGEFVSIYSQFGETLTVDHHGGEYFSKYNCLKSYASTCQIVYEILKQTPVKLNKSIATCLFMGLCTDTGNFMHNSTDSASFLMAADLCKYDVENDKISQAFFKNISLSRTKLLAKALSRLRTHYDDKLVVLYVTKRDLEDLGLELADTTGLVQNAINISSAKIGVCISEYSTNVYKVSMRGKDFSVCEICQEFGGGGHAYAAGCMISGFLEDVIEKIVRVTGFYL